MASSQARPRAQHGRTLLIPLAVGLAATVAYGLLGWQQWRAIYAPSWDLGIFTQLSRAYGELRAPIVPIKGDDFHLLGDHFHPMLVLLAPVWWIWPSGHALLWVQAGLFGFSAVPLTQLARERLGAAAGTLVGAVYAFSFGLQAAAAVQFHEIAFAVPLLALALTCFVRGQVTGAAAWAAPLVFVKEDLGLTVVVFAMLIAWRFPHARRTAIALAAWGLAWFVLATFVIVPMLNPHVQYDYVSNVGSFWHVFMPWQKWHTVLMLILATGVIGVRSPLIGLLVPTLAWRFVGNVEFYWDWYWHYNAVLMPMVSAALIDALSTRHPWGRHGPTTELSSETSSGSSSNSTATLVRTRLPMWPVRAFAYCAIVLVTVLPGPRIPLLPLADPGAWKQSPRPAAADRLLNAVPADAVLATDIPLLARAVPHAQVQWLHGKNQRVPDCAMFDAHAFSWQGLPPADPAIWAQQQWGRPFETVDQGEGFTLVCQSATA